MEKKLITFDLDGTLTTSSSWQKFNELLGITAEEDQKLFELYIGGELKYADWIGAIASVYRERGRKVTEADVEALAQSIELRPGAREAIDAAANKGYKVIIVSGAIDTIARTIGKHLGVTTVFSTNEAVYDDNGVLIDLDLMGDERISKFAMLEAYASEHSFDLKDVVAVGDGGNDIDIFERTKGIQIGNNEELAKVAWKTVTSLSEVEALL